MSAPLLSIITITYKDPKGLGETFSSLQKLLSTKLSFEHIVVDSSPELNREVLVAQNTTWPLKHIVTEPRGIYAAINEGVRQSSGTWVWVLNSGDALYDVSVLLEIIDAGDKVSAQVVLAGANLMRGGAYDYYFPAAHSLWGAIRGSNHQCHQAMIYRRSVFDSFGLYDTNYSIAADYDFHWRLYLASASSVSIDKALASYDMGGSSSNYKKSMQQFLMIQQKNKSAIAMPRYVGILFLWAAERARIGFFKFLRELPLARYLRRLWVLCKR